MIVVESSELGGTLIALSIPGLKPLVSSWYTSARHNRKSSSSRLPLTWQGNRLNSPPDIVAYEMNRPAKTLTPVSSNGESRFVAHDSDQELVREELKGPNGRDDLNYKTVSISERYQVPHAHVRDPTPGTEGNGLYRMQRTSREPDNRRKRRASTLFTLPSAFRS